MSTDVSVSEDVSTSGALSPGHGDGEAGKDSEASLVSSEGTSLQTTGGAVDHLTPACSKIRSLCLSRQEALEQQKNLPFINPSSLETLRVLVQEIQNSGETDPEIWKDCEGRWLHLFQLVEKQYQEQILAQQEQYQCQIQLIQDEIKALVQLQNRQASVPPPSDSPAPPEPKPSPDVFPLVTGGGSAPRPPRPPHHHHHTAFSSPERRAATVLSSGYGTLSAWESSGLEPAGDQEEEVEEEEQQEEQQEEQWGAKLHWTAVGRRQEVSDGGSGTVNQQKSSSSSNQQLTSWAQRHQGRARRTRPGPAQDQDQPAETHTDPKDQHPAAGTSGGFNLRRSDSLLSEASGLTYWRLNECDLYRRLPDSFDSGASFLLQEAPLSPTPSPEPRPSLREIYHNKRRADWRRCDGGGAPQVSTLDRPADARQSDRTSGFTSPSRFSSPSPAAPPPLSPRVVSTPVSPHPGDTDCTSDASSAAAEGSHAHTSTLKPLPPPGGPQAQDPLVLSLLRQDLREKHSRHLADLKFYYETEIQMLRDKLKLPQDLEERNQVLTLRCKHLEEALTAATSRVQDLEAQNQVLEQKLAQWAERYAAAMAALQQRLEDSRRSGREKDDLLDRLRTRVQHLEEEAGEREARRERELQMLQDLRGQYDSLRTEQDGTKNKLVVTENKLAVTENKLLVTENQLVVTENQLVVTENKLLDANDHVSELKRLVCKLESQVKQMDHENQSRARFFSHSSSQPSGAGLLHHPDLLLSPSRGQTEPDVTHRKSSRPPSPPGVTPLNRKSSRPPSPPGVTPLNRKSSRPPSPPGVTPLNRKSSRPPSPPGVTPLNRKSSRPPSCPSVDQSSGTSSSGEASTGGSWRSASSPENEQLRPPSSQRDGGRREGGAPVLTPVMRALIELEETRATQSRAPWFGSPRTTVGFVERRHKESIQERVGLVQVEREVVLNLGGGGGGAGAAGGAVRSHGGAAALLRAQRSLSPEGHRSSSLPPPGQRNGPPHTPTKRETLLVPVSARSSPKRCPTENFSTAFGHPLPREEHLLTGVEGLADRRRHSFTSSPRKKLQFSTDGEQDASLAPDRRPRLGREEPGGPGGPGGAEVSLQSLADAERLFDDLTKEKLQVEAALSRLPAGGRVTLQTRLEEVALEERLERLDRQLGSLRRILKRFHVLRSSSNT